LYGWWKFVPLLLSYPYELAFTVGGSLFYFIFWRPASITWGVGDRLVAFEIKFTRVLARQLTRARADDNDWLVISSPYFFPTTAIVLGLIAALIPIPLIPLSSFAIGFALAYFVRAMRVVQRSEPDELRKLGYVWSGMFLPSMNLLALGLLVAIGVGELSLAKQFCGACMEGVNHLWTLSRSMFN
jgi:hypothetical protein